MLGEAEATHLAEGLADQPFTVKSVTEKPFRRTPAPPFMTSTLQQEACRKLRFGAQRAMQVAQRLYENGWITYMRTDSTTLSDEALAASRGQAAQLYGPEYVPDKPRRYERKVKNAQEAHEAIRPAGESFRTPDQAAADLPGDELPALRPHLEADRRLPDGRRHRDRGPGPAGGDALGWARGRRPAGGRVRRLGPGRSPSPDSSGPTSRDPTTPRPIWPNARSSSRRSPKATP